MVKAVYTAESLLLLGSAFFFGAVIKCIIVKLGHRFQWYGISIVENVFLFS